jgi:hypothetical protein
VPTDLDPAEPPLPSSGPRALAIHMGVRSPSLLTGVHDDCPMCETDAVELARITRAAGYTTRLLRNAEVTSTTLEALLDDAACRLHAGDALILTFSGHGTGQFDLEKTEPSQYDSTWVLYNREFYDNELFHCLTKFESGVRILIIAASCKSGTIPYIFPENEKPTFSQRLNHTVYSKHDPLDALHASVVAWGAAADGQDAIKGNGPNTVFITALLNAYRSAPTRSLQETFNVVAAACSPTQDPQYCAIGPRDCAFETAPLFARPPYATCQPLVHPACTVTKP